MKKIPLINSPNSSSGTIHYVRRYIYYTLRQWDLRSWGMCW